MDIFKRHFTETENKNKKRNTSNVIVKFDIDAFENYKKLQEAVKFEKHSSEKPTYSRLLESIERAISNIKSNPYYGNLIPHKNITKEIIRRYDTDKIFRIELVGFWRLLYTVVGDEARIIAFILEYMDHKEYDKLFGYRKK